MSETRLTPARRAEIALLCKSASDSPWEKALPEALADAREALTQLRYREGTTFDELKQRRAELVEANAIMEAMVGVADGLSPSEFYESFPSVQAVLNLRDRKDAEIARLTAELVNARRSTDSAEHTEHWTCEGCEEEFTDADVYFTTADDVKLCKACWDELGKAALFTGDATEGQG